MDLGGHDANVQTLAERFPHAKIVRYYDNHLDTIRRCIAKARTPWVWVLSSCCDYTDFNFNYRAVPWEASQLHCWASGDEKFGDTFLINIGEFKKQWDIELLEYYEYINWHADGVSRLPQNIFVMNMGGHEITVPNAQVVRYYNSHLDTIKRCVFKATTPTVWITASCCDYADFNFNRVMPLWGPEQLHCWSSGNERFGDTFLIDVKRFKRQENIELLEWYKDIHWHADGVPRLPVETFIMNLGGHDDNVKQLQKITNSQTIRYYDNHLDTIKRCISKAATPAVWIIASCCDYSNFNFNYIISFWGPDQLHCWASGDEKFGDTFLINTHQFRKQQDIELLEWYKDVNWHYPGVPRLSWPVLTTQTEDITTELKQYKFDSPYVWLNEPVDFDVPLWNKRAFYSFNDTGSISIAPRDIQAHLGTQIYDYPYIIKQKTADLTPTLLDIIYISNGEPEAERWYTHLAQTCEREVKRVIDVDGRSRAYKAAAELSTTPWFWAIFAKLEVMPEFDWTWQPDWLQEPKHYIFNSRNPVNGLEYGHMGVIAYNKQLVLDTDSPGLDFTLSKAHAVVPHVSAIAHYNTTPELTWRTAFREVLKLSDDVVKTGSVESTYRMDTWLTVADGDHAEFSLLGAADAVDYYNKINGDYTELMRSYEWAWLKDYYAKRYSV
jgi:hypothetical protein